MRKTSFILFTIALAAITFRCSIIADEPDTGSVTNNELFSQAPDIYDYLSCQGFDLTDAKLYDEHVLVEGDLAFRLDMIRGNMDNGYKSIADGRTEQYVVNTSSVVGFNNVININYYISSSLVTPELWDLAIHEAAQDWEDIPNCRVSFNHVTAVANADLKFYRDNSRGVPGCARNLNDKEPKPLGALAEFPGNGQPGRWISVSLEYDNNYKSKVTWIRHEIGHALGFRHDNPFNEPINSYNCGNAVLGANKLVGTPTSDGASVMVANINNVDKIEFSTNDQLAASYLYPAGYTAPQISSITQYYANTYTKDVRITMTNPSVRMYRYRVERLPPWSSTPVQYQEYTTTGNTFWLYDVPKGSWNFRIKGLNYARDAQINGSPWTYYIY